jgi:FKBP-type peptidyl-prolyl cis-trans isomerase FkpA
MNLRLIQTLTLLLTAVVFMTSCDNSHPGFKKNENGIYYQIYSQVDSTSDIKIDSGSFWRLKMSYGNLDTLLFDASINTNAFDIPFQKPAYKGDINEALAMFAKGDSASFIIKADSFFLKTARSPEVPEMFKENNDLQFWIKMEDILTSEELEANRLAELETRKASELTDLTVYLSGNYPDLDPTESGLFIVKEKSGKGKFPNDGDFLNFDFKVSTLDGNLLYDSEAAGRPVDHEKGKPFDTEGFTEGLNTMSVGDEVTLIVPSKLAFKDMGRQGMIEPYTTMVYWIRLNSVKSKAQHDKELAEQKAKKEQEANKLKNAEQETIANYIKENNVTVAPTESGLYYIETAEGTGDQPQAGDKVKVHYHGTLLDGTKFDSSYDRDSPFEFTLGRGQVIKGWDEGIALMKVGGKATLIVPSIIGYGAGSRGNVIHAYAPLKFDVELLEVTKAE